MTTTPTSEGSRRPVDRTAANELRARQACRELEQWGIHGAEPAYDPAQAGCSGQVAVDPEELLYGLNAAAEGEW